MAAPETGGVGMAEEAANTEVVSTGRRTAPVEVWAAVQADYLAGMSGPDCCRRHGVTLSALRDRAARQGWRRADQPWTPPAALDPRRLDPWDEGRLLEERIGGDLDRLDWADLGHVADARMMRAVLRGDAAEALRWHRVAEILDAREAELHRWVEAEDALRLEHGPHPAEPDSPDSPDSVLEAGDDCGSNPPPPGEGNPEGVEGAEHAHGARA
ncbi:hypothetical protein ACO2Q1_14790 [Brevundimonas sp. VNH65]|uniref:hypothetical protein n=1 Tax=Brevundimonas sp. VNH65 TaxID=3400917 RepID=UPI003BFD12CD